MDLGAEVLLAGAAHELDTIVATAHPVDPPSGRQPRPAVSAMFVVSPPRWESRAGGQRLADESLDLFDGHHETIYVLGLIGEECG